MTYKILHHYTCDRCKRHVHCEHITDPMPRHGDPLAQFNHEPPLNWQVLSRRSVNEEPRGPNSLPPWMDDLMLCGDCILALNKFLSGHTVAEARLS